MKKGTDNQSLENTQDLEVYDASEGKVVKRTADQQRRARLLYGQMKMAEIIQAIVLKQFMDGDHHLDMGYSTKEEFCQVELKESRQSVNRKLRVAERFAELIPITDSGLDVKKLSQGEQDNLESVNQIGLRKLYEFARIEDADFSEAISDGIVKFSDGREIPLEEIEARSRREWEQIFKEAKDKLTDDLNKYRVKKDEAEAELKKLKSEIVDKEERYETGARLQALYASKETSIEVHYKRVQLAQELLVQAGKAIGMVRLPEDPDDVPEDLQALVCTLHRQLIGFRSMLFEANHYYIQSEAELLPTQRDFSLLDEIQQRDQEGLNDGESLDETTGEIDLPKIRTDRSRMAIKIESHPEGEFGTGHGWKNLEKGFETEDEMNDRFQELIASGEYQEG